MRRNHVITAVLAIAALAAAPATAQTTPATPPAPTGTQQQAAPGAPALAGRYHGLAWRVYRPGGTTPAAAGDTLNVTLPQGARLLGVKWQNDRIIVGFRSTATPADVSRFYTQRMTGAGFRAAGGNAASGLRFTRADDTVVLTITRPAATSYRAVIDLTGVRGDTSRDVNPNQAAAGAGGTAKGTTGGSAGGTAGGAAGGAGGSTAGAAGGTTGSAGGTAGGTTGTARGTTGTGNTSSTGVVGNPESTLELPRQETSGTGTGSGTNRGTNTGDGSGAAANPSGGTGAPGGAAGSTGTAGTARGTTGTAAGGTTGTAGAGGTSGGRNDAATSGAAQGSAQGGSGATGTGTTVRVGPSTTGTTGTAATGNNRADQNYDKAVTATPGKLTLNVLPVGSPVAAEASDATFTLVPPRGSTKATVNIDGARVFLGYFTDQPLDEQFKYFDDQFTRQGFRRVTGSGANVNATANAKITYRRGNGDVSFELQQFGGDNAYRVIADFGNLVDSLK